jgi:hypothetical protein
MCQRPDTDSTGAFHDHRDLSRAAAIVMPSDRDQLLLPLQASTQAARPAVFDTVNHMARRWRLL